jgi:predicted RNase H-like nuclease (RuvC/YqgF family)
MPDFSTNELLLAGTTIFSTTMAAIYKLKERRVAKEEKTEELRAAKEQRSEDNEIKILLGHIEQLQALWQHSLLQIEKLRTDLDATREENAQLRAEVKELRKKVEEHDKA